MVTLGGQLGDRQMVRGHAAPASLLLPPSGPALSHPQPLAGGGRAPTGALPPGFHGRTAAAGRPHKDTLGKWEKIK